MWFNVEIDTFSLNLLKNVETIEIVQKEIRDTKNGNLIHFTVQSMQFQLVMEWSITIGDITPSSGMQ